MNDQPDAKPQNTAVELDFQVRRAAMTETSTEPGLVGFAVVGFDLFPELIELAQRRGKLDRVEDKVPFFIGDAPTHGPRLFRP